MAFASLGSATGAQSYSSAYYTMFSGSSFTVSSTCAARRAEEDLTYTSCQGEGAHTGTSTNKKCHHVSLASLGTSSERTLNLLPTSSAATSSALLMQRDTELENKGTIDQLFCRIKMTMLAYNKDFNYFNTKC